MSSNLSSVIYANQFKTLLKYRRLFKNYLVVVYKISKNYFPVIAETRTGGLLTFSNRAQAWLITEALDRGAEWKFEEDSLILRYKNRLLSLSGTYDKSNPRLVNGDPIHVFLEEDYSYLRDAGDLCIDVGANIGDSSIWLALNGFSRVIAVEPYPQNFKKLLYNVNENGFGSIIDCVNKGLSSRTHSVTIDDKAYVDGAYDVHEAPEGSSVIMTTLDDLISPLVESKLCLKMDCEGCEYDTILNADPKTLTKFSRIMIEYHYGYYDLKEKLEKCGFSVECTKPVRHINPNTARKEMSVGYLFVRR